MECDVCGRGIVNARLSADGKFATVTVRDPFRVFGINCDPLQTASDGIIVLNLERPNGGVEFSAYPYLLWPYLEAKRQLREQQEAEAKRPEIEARIARMEKAIERLKTRLGDHAIVNMQKSGEE